MAIPTDESEVTIATIVHRQKILSDGYRGLGRRTARGPEEAMPIPYTNSEQRGSFHGGELVMMEPLTGHSYSLERLDYWRSI